MRHIIASLALLCVASSPLRGESFTTLLSKGPSAADKWLGKATVLRDGSRDYSMGGYGFTLYYSGSSLVKITIAYFPDARPAKSPEDIARMIGTDIKIGQKNMQGILEKYFMTDLSLGIWEVLLTPGDDGYSVANIIPPKN